MTPIFDAVCRDRQFVYMPPTPLGTVRVERLVFLPLLLEDTA